MAMTLKQLVNDGDLMRLEVLGKISRDSWAHQKEPLAAEFGEQIYERRCLLSLNQALYIDSTGVEWLLTSHRRFLEHGGVLILHSLTPSSRQLLKVMRMDLVLNIVDDEHKAQELAQKLVPSNGR